jgi:hypothetical protein
MRCRRLGDRQKVLTVCRRYGSGFVRAGLGEPFGGELADGLQQPVAEGPAVGLCHDKALVHQRAEQVGDLNRLDVTEAANRFGGVQIEAFREERISLGIDFLAAVSGQTRPDQRVMVGKHLRVAAIPQPPQQRRRALNVGEKKRESLHGHSVEGPAKPRQPSPGAAGQAPSLSLVGSGARPAHTSSLSRCFTSSARRPGA